MAPRTGSILLSDYEAAIAKTDKLPREDLQTVLLGLYGEVGSILAAAKKYHREGNAYPWFRKAVEEEFGDALWYFAAICRRLCIPLDETFSQIVASDEYVCSIAANDFIDSPLSQIVTPVTVRALDPALLELGRAATSLFALTAADRDRAIPVLKSFADAYIRAVSVSRIAFAAIVHANIHKTQGRFLPPTSELPTFDDKFAVEERLPENFEITIDQRKSGKSYLSWNGVFIGDPLTDNISDPDAYRFHDVFHFAHAAILHWSPVMRSLIKQKRKSSPKTDEEQDGGRAIVVEEGLTAWIFARAKLLNHFEGQTSVSFDILKAVGEFVAGYEVEKCPLSLWEVAILEGYRVFRQVKAANGGVIIGDRKTRTLVYRPLPGLLK